MAMGIKIFFIILSIILIGFDIHFLPEWFSKSFSLAISTLDRHTYRDLSVFLIVTTLISLIIAVSKITINGSTAKGLLNSSITLSKPTSTDKNKFTFTTKIVRRKDDAQ